MLLRRIVLPVAALVVIVSACGDPIGATLTAPAIPPTPDAGPIVGTADAGGDAGGDASKPHPDAGASCSNGTKDQAETDVDCGGGTCGKCADLKACTNGPRDCVSNTCIAGSCQEPSCMDGTLDGSETDLDCGGGGCAGCATSQACVDGARDCASGICAGNQCQAPACDDGVKNGAETDLDCGGGTCAVCTINLVCTDGPRDCKSGVCNNGVCEGALGEGPCAVNGDCAPSMLGTSACFVGGMIAACTLVCNNANADDPICMQLPPPFTGKCNAKKLCQPM